MHFVLVLLQKKKLKITYDLWTCIHTKPAKFWCLQHIPYFNHIAWEAGFGCHSLNLHWEDPWCHWWCPPGWMRASPWDLFSAGGWIYGDAEEMRGRKMNAAPKGKALTHRNPRQLSSLIFWAGMRKHEEVAQQQLRAWPVGTSRNGGAAISSGTPHSHWDNRSALLSPHDVSSSGEAAA